VALLYFYLVQYIEKHMRNRGSTIQRGVIQLLLRIKPIMRLSCCDGESGPQPFVAGREEYTPQTSAPFLRDTFGFHLKECGQSCHSARKAIEKVDEGY
jgi:hypothetical protein